MEVWDVAAFWRRIQKHLRNEFNRIIRSPSCLKKVMYIFVTAYIEILAKGYIKLKRK